MLSYPKAAQIAGNPEEAEQYIANLARENEKFCAALKTIRDSHIGDQPAALNIDDAQWIRRCHAELRCIARNVLRDLGY